MCLLFCYAVAIGVTALQMHFTGLVKITVLIIKNRDFTSRPTQRLNCLPELRAMF